MAPGPRWNRVFLACEKCRRSKKRCDGGRPRCTACLHRGVIAPCVYSKAPERPSGLRRRATQPSPDEQARGLTSDTESLESPDAAIRANLDGAVTDSNAQVAGFASATLIGDNSDNSPSSVAAFLTQILPKEAIQSAPLASLSGADIVNEDASSAADEAVAVLADPSQVQSLINSYSVYVYPQLPILSTERAMRFYERVDKSKVLTNSHDITPVECENACAFIALALGSRVQGRFHLAQGLYERSRSLISQDLLDIANIEVLELLLLSSMYLQLTSHAIRRWNATGWAVRMAIGLGLHVERTSYDQDKQQEQQTRRRLWYCCVMIDRFTSIVFGKPTMTAFPWNVPLPCPDPDIYVDEEGNLLDPQVGPTGMDCFIASCGMLDYLTAILDLHATIDRVCIGPMSNNQGRERSIILTEVLRLDQQMAHWHAQLPQHFHSLPQNAAHQFQYALINARFRLLRLLLHRPLLTMHLKHTSSVSSAASYDDVDQESFIVSQSARLCVLSACELAETLHSVFMGGFRSTAWHVVFYCFTAGLVLATALDESRLGYGINADIAKHFQQSLVVLQAQAGPYQTAHRAIHLLHLARDHMVRSDQPSQAQTGSWPPATNEIPTTTFESQDRTGMPLLEMSMDFSLEWLDACIEDLDLFAV